MDWAKLFSAGIEILAPVAGKILAAATTPEMTPEQVAALDAELSQMVTQARKDIFDSARLQGERNARVDAAVVAKFGKVDE